MIAQPEHLVSFRAGDVNVRIPLDYYRILGLPIQATKEQLEQAHRDRTLQLPRREYSEVAIQARKQLIDEAYQVLSDSSQRQRYDSRFLEEKYTESTKPAVGVARTEDSYSPTIEIEDQQLAGALLILLELGEYELVIRLGRPYLSSGDASAKSGQYGNPMAVLPDVGLTLALACLELGREQWQQHQYENAAESLETGSELLVRENILPNLRSEIQTDLYKLRPYRILELVARPLENRTARQQGIQLLKAMLQARGGIDGAQDDLSGLGVEDFLRFIQQLRGYLTVAEQQDVFEAEAQRASAVGTYLAVYALLARGFAKHQPALIRRAKQLLMRLGSRQDIHLEHAVCAVLLGQTEEASHALERSREQEPLAFIQEHSQGAPDLLPGLCLYSERWLQQEVFPFFRDLDQQPATLKDYFANEQVQTYLENMPLEEAVPPPPTTARTAWMQGAGTGTLGQQSMTVTGGVAAGAAGAAAFSGQSQGNLNEEEPVTDWLGSDQFGTAGRVAQLSPEGRLQPRDPSELNGGGNVSGDARDALATTDSPAKDSRLAKSRARRSSSRRTPKWGRLSLVVILGLLCVGALGFVTMQLLGWLSNIFSGPKIQGEPLSINVAQQAIEFPQGDAQIADISRTEAIATEVIQAWFAAKSDAFGSEHQTAKLRAILVEPSLARWLGQAQDAEANGVHIEYTHSLDLESVEPDDPQANELVVRATVSEEARYFQYGTVNEDASYNDVLNMQYDLIRQGDRWLIKSFAPVD